MRVGKRVEGIVCVGGGEGKDENTPFIIRRRKIYAKQREGARCCIINYDEKSVERKEDMYRDVFEMEIITVYTFYMHTFSVFYIGLIVY